MKRLLTLDNLIEFYSTKKRNMKFDISKSGEPVVVQVEGNMIFNKDEKDYSEGLTKARLQACHTEKNLNKSSISFETMRDKMLPTFKNRPILGYIHYVDGKPQFYDHRMHTEENENGESELVYDEIAVGIIPETNNAELVYDEKEKHYNVLVDGYLFDSYTKAPEIVEREGELSVSVELAINSMSWDAKTGCLNIEDGYFSGVTILGVDENGNKVKPGMANSNIKLKDFSESNNSMFSSITDEEQEQLIEMREKIDTLLSRFNIDEEEISQENYGKEEKDVEKDEIKVEEEVTETKEVEVTTEEESTEEVTDATTETESEETVDTPEVVEDEACKKKHEEESEEVIETESEETEEVTETESEEVVETEEVTEEEACGGSGKKKKYSAEFELSHDDVRCALYQLLESYCEADNDWYWISEVFDSYFVYQGCMGNFWGQKYTKDGDNVAFDGERYELFAEFVTKSEKEELESMRSNYSSIQEKLGTYEKAELDAQKDAVLCDTAYAEFAESEGFKSIKENIETYSVDELRTACDLAFAKCVKAKGTFALNTEEKPAEKKPSFFAFAKQETNSNFLDGLLKK